MLNKEKNINIIYKTMPVTRKQRGGNPEEPVLESQPMPEPPKDPFMDSLVSGGGKKKKAAAAKKPVAKKPASAKKSSSKKGGALVEDIKNLAVPFAILLAKQGLEGMMGKKKEEKKPPAMAAKASKTASVRRRVAEGGDCTSCTRTSTSTGGSSMKSRYAQLSKEIDAFLSKY
jgi:hypothetical protein